jgi:hypothetical protein
MADKSNFTPDEWKVLLESAAMAGIAVTAAEPHGLWGLLKESFASANALVQAKMEAGASPLIKAVIADLETSEGRKHRARRPQAKAHKRQTLRDQVHLRCNAPASRGNRRRQGTRRCRRVQGLAAPCQPKRRRSSAGGRLPRLWRHCGQRRGEGNAR